VNTGNKGKEGKMDNYNEVTPEKKNEALKEVFKRFGLDPFEIQTPVPDVDWENRRLESLLGWVFKYRECPDREKLAAQGLLFPPVDPGEGPDRDWRRFKGWIKGLQTKLPLRDLLHHLQFPPPEEIGDAQAAELMEKLDPILEEIGISLDLWEGVPPRLAYEIFYAELDEDFELLDANETVHLTGCTGFCPDCLQRPWCENGCTSLWKEDEAAGKMVFPTSTQRYASATRQSLEILRELDENAADWED
jgi:hypothetical protein